MKIALESSSLFFKSYTGIPFYIDNLYKAMCTFEEIEPTLAFRLKNKWGANVKPMRTVLNRPHVWHVMGHVFPNKKFDVCHSLHTPFLDLKSSLKVATVHDLAVHLPKFEHLKLTTPYFQKKRAALFTEFSKKADVLIAVSETTKKDFLKLFNFPAEKIHVVPLAPAYHINNMVSNDMKILQVYGLEPKSYFIFLGGVSTRKNTLNLIKGYHLSKSKKNHKLIITGKVESKDEIEVRAFIKHHNLDSQVIITQYLDNDALNTLYQNAKCFLFPTLYEGFGIPILEAMLHELPVLTSTTGAAPETAGGYAVLVDPLNTEDIASGIDRLELVDKTQIDAAKNYALLHTWERTAQRTLDIYRKYM